MTAATIDQLVSDYLSRLETAAADLPDARRAELLAEIREHIETARSEGVAADEATTRTMLDQLGEPEEIAAAARAELDDAHAASAPPSATAETGPVGAQSAWTGLEITAVVLLGVGGLASLPLLGLLGPVVALLAGLALVWASSQWTRREKWIGTAIAATPIPAAFLLVVVLGIW